MLRGREAESRGLVSDVTQENGLVCKVPAVDQSHTVASHKVWLDHDTDKLELQLSALIVPYIFAMSQGLSMRFSLEFALSQIRLWSHHQCNGSACHVSALLRRPSPRVWHSPRRRSSRVLKHVFDAARTRVCWLGRQLWHTVNFGYLNELPRHHRRLYLECPPSQRSGSCRQFQYKNPTEGEMDRGYYIVPGVHPGSCC